MPSIDVGHLIVFHQHSRNGRGHILRLASLARTASVHQDATGRARVSPNAMQAGP